SSSSSSNQQQPAVSSQQSEFGKVTRGISLACLASLSERRGQQVAAVARFPRVVSSVWNPFSVSFFLSRATRDCARPLTKVRIGDCERPPRGNGIERRKTNEKKKQQKYRETGRSFSLRLEKQCTRTISMELGRFHKAHQSLPK
uniref:Uncharacterized protein n=1 Tax=Anopheles minimus TaxID=112268 RepID=A0A182WPK7_9DIPT